MRFFKIVEVDKYTLFENGVGYDDRYDVYCMKAEDGNVYVAIDEDAEDEFEICLNMFDEE